MKIKTVVEKETTIYIETRPERARICCDAFTIAAIDERGLEILPWCKNTGLPTDHKGRIKVIGYTPDDELPTQRGAAELERLIETARRIRQGVNVARIIEAKEKFDAALTAYETAVKE